MGNLKGSGKAEKLLELYLHAFCQDRMLEEREKNENCL